MSEQQTAKPKKTNGALTEAKPDRLSVFDDLEALRRANPTDLLNETAHDVYIAVRRPNKREHFRVCDDPNMSVNLSVYIHKPEGSMDEETYYVAENMRAYLQEMEELRVVQAVLCATLSGANFLWCLPVPDGDGPVRSHVASARSIAREALTKWVRMKWRRADNAYYPFIAENAETEPRWPDKTFNEILKIAFRDKIIDSRDHPVMKELRGIKTKVATDQGSWLV